MSKADVRQLKHGREVWRQLEPLFYSRDRHRVFEDWLDLMLNAHLSFTDNLSRSDFVSKFQAQKLDGRYEKRYMDLIGHYDRKANGQFIAAYAELCKATEESQQDVLGEIYMAMISYGEHGQFFTPSSVTKMMVEVMGNVEDGASILDPACGSGGILIEAGKRNPNATLHGVDVDSRCAKMCAVNMMLFDFNAEVILGNTLSGEYQTEWRIRRGGFIHEQDVPQETKAKIAKTVQPQLFAA